MKTKQDCQLRITSSSLVTYRQNLAEPADTVSPRWLYHRHGRRLSSSAVVGQTLGRQLLIRQLGFYAQNTHLLFLAATSEAVI